MGKNLETQYAFRCDKETILKLEYIAQQNTRTRNQEMKHIIKQYIANYETENGEIKIQEVTKEDALKAQIGNIKNSKNQTIIETMKKSLENGINFGNAEK